jgi:hypothetical protein
MSLIDHLLPTYLTKADRIPESFGLHSFTLLARTGEAIVYGLVGKFWRLNYGLTPVASGEAFTSFSENGVARLALGFSVENASGGQTRLVTKAACIAQTACRVSLSHGIGS